MAAARIDPQAVRRALRDGNLRARRSLSQNFLADADVLEAIVSAAEPRAGRRILEIGPGLGILTEALLAAGAAVTAVELDTGLAARLRRIHAEAIEVATSDPDRPGGLRLVEGDILDQSIAELVTPPFDVVANLPYHITSPVLHRLLGTGPRPERCVLMVQREVANRIASPPGGMSYLSVFVQYHARVRIAFVVPPEAFEPEPSVASAVVVIEPFAPAGAPSSEPSGSAASAPSEDELWRLVQAAFRERRKMLKNVLVRQLRLTAEQVDRGLAAAGIASDRRPQTVSVEEWLRLVAALGPLPPDLRGRATDAGLDA